MPDSKTTTQVYLCPDCGTQTDGTYLWCNFCVPNQPKKLQVGR